MIGLIVTLQVDEAKREEFERDFAQAKAMVDEKEDGNLLYELYRSRDDANCYHVLEKYTDNAALAAHGEAEHVKALFSKFREYLTAKPDIKVVDLV